MLMGAAYQQMLDDRSLLLMQMQAYAACADEEIRDVVRDEMLRLVNFVQSASGAPEAAIREWLAYGMLMNVVAAMDLTDVDADWARMMCPVTGYGAGGDGRRRGRQEQAHARGGEDEVEDAGRAPGSWPDPPSFQVLGSK